MGLGFWTLQLLPSTINSCHVLQNTWNMLPKPFKIISTEIVANIFIDLRLFLTSQSPGHEPLKLFYINPNSELFPLFHLVQCYVLQLEHSAAICCLKFICICYMQYIVPFPTQESI